MTTQTNTHLVSKDLAKQISDEIKRYAEELCAQHGLQVQKIRSNYGDYYKFSIEASMIQISDDGIDMGSEYVQRYQQAGYFAVVDAQVMHLRAPVGTRFTHAGKQYLLVGVRARGKDKIIAKRADSDDMVLFIDEIIPVINKAGETA